MTLEKMQRNPWPTCPNCETELRDDFLARRDVNSGAEIDPVDVECWECGYEFEYKFCVRSYATTYWHKDDSGEGSQ